MHKREILFDIDGTLVDSNDAHVDAWQRAFEGGWRADGDQLVAGAGLTVSSASNDDLTLPRPAMTRGGSRR